jgi:hypothetical protein
VIVLVPPENDWTKIFWSDSDPRQLKFNDL